jgi:pilus assembly protein CpaE
MGQLLHVCLYNTDPEASAEMTAQLQALNFVRLVPEVNTPDGLATVLHDYEVNLVVFHLDPKPESIIEVIEQVSTRYPAVALIAIGSNTSPKDILAPIRAGCDQFVCKPIDPADLASAVGRVAAKRLLSRTKGRCICVTGSSGGAGATSIACNLALEISQVTDTDCALVDLDLQFGDAALNFDAEPKYSFYDVAEAGAGIDRTVLAGSLTKLPCKISLLARPHSLDQCEYVSPEVVHRVIELLTSTHENVVVDCPRRLDHHNSVAFKHADLVLIVCQLLVPSVRNAHRFYEALIRWGIPEDRVEIVVNRWDSSARRVEMKDIEDMFGKPVYATVPNDYQFVARSLDLGRPIAALDRNNPVRSSIRKVARRIVADPAEKTKAGGKLAKKGLLSRLFE